MDVNSNPIVEDLDQEDPSKAEATENPSLELDTVEPTTSPNEAIISLHALSGISTPKTLKIKGYIKHHQLVMLIDNVNTHNFINMSKDATLHCFIYPFNKK